MRRWFSMALTIIGAAWLLCAFVPEALAFPYYQQIGSTKLYAESPISPAAAAVLARSDRLLNTSPIARAGGTQRIFLTNGGWRWHVLAPGEANALAITRPLTESIVINRGDLASDSISTAVGRRSLSGIIAHERTHGLIRAHFGLSADWRYPAWLREGYCDYVAGGGTLSDAQAAALKAQGRTMRALPYYDGRKRVEAILARNGGSVDRLFAQAVNR